MIEKLKPRLQEPFPSGEEHWKCPNTGLIVPKLEVANLEYRRDIITAAENDEGLQRDLLCACSESLLYWVNSFVWTYHQFDVIDGERVSAVNTHEPFITWEVQDDLLNRFVKCLPTVEQVLAGEGKSEDILIDKSRDMGASWLCIMFLHWLWLFRDNAQLLELSRTEDYVDKAGNMKALFQRHDYINQWLPDWMLPPDCLYGQRERTKMHMRNRLTGGCIDGESTTQHAASGDRRLVGLLDEFSKVEKGTLMRSATRDACLMRIVNSTGAGPGTEYSKWKKSGKIQVFPLMWWAHPDKGKGRYVVQDEVTKAWKIRSAWYDAEELVRSPKEMAREIDAIDMEAGSLRLTTANIDRHIAIFGRDPKSRWDIKFKRDVADDKIKDILKRHDVTKVDAKRVKEGRLRIWVDLIDGRLDQTKDYVMGSDISKGQGASNSVISIKCRQTNEKVAEWRDAETPPYNMAKVAVAIALWVGGRKKLPFQKWEMNGPGWDFGRVTVKDYHYPYYYRNRKVGDSQEKKGKKYGWHSSPSSKDILMDNYDRALANGGYINHSVWALEEAKNYVYYDGGGCGPAELVEESSSAKKTHGDCVIADALTIDHLDYREGKLDARDKETPRNIAGRRRMAMDKRKRTRSKRFDLR